MKSLTASLDASTFNCFSSPNGFLSMDIAHPVMINDNLTHNFLSCFLKEIPLSHISYWSSLELHMIHLKLNMTDPSFWKVKIYIILPLFSKFLFLSISQPVRYILCFTLSRLLTFIFRFGAVVKSYIFCLWVFSRF